MLTSERAELVSACRTAAQATILNSFGMGRDFVFVFIVPSFYGALVTYIAVRDL